MQTNQPPENKRASERFDVKLPVRILYLEKEFGKSFNMRDVSSEGAQFTTTHQLEKGQHLSLEIFIPKGKPLVFRGEVMWVSKLNETESNVGFKFDRDNTDNVTILRDKAKLFQSIFPRP